jgi:hypothetical protein
MSVAVEGEVKQDKDDQPGQPVRLDEVSRTDKNSHHVFQLRQASRESELWVFSCRKYV